MKKGIARLGIIGFVPLFAFSCFAPTCFASSVSDLLISEIMANPAGLPDSRGEWFELYNPTTESINLRGIDLGDDGSNRHRFDTDLLILPKEFLTLARSADPGFVADYTYDNFALANSGDEIVFLDGLHERLRFEYGSGFALAGVSRELQQLPMIESNYGLTAASLSYGSGDIGTPGMAGDRLLWPSAVPIPATAWLFLSGILTMVFPSAIYKPLTARGIKNTRATPATSRDSPSISAIPIRRTATQAGISKRLIVSTPRSILSPLILTGVTS